MAQVGKGELLFLREPHRESGPKSEAAKEASLSSHVCVLLEQSFCVQGKEAQGSSASEVSIFSQLVGQTQINEKLLGAIK